MNRPLSAKKNRQAPRLSAVCIVLLTFLVVRCAVAAPVDFVREVRPIFEKHCADCHGEKKQKGGLRLDVKEAALKGGDNQGPNIIPAKAKESSLIQRIRNCFSPPDTISSAWTRER
jgi:mono/diheme cytochrome c family protein